MCIGGKLHTVMSMTESELAQTRLPHSWEPPTSHTLLPSSELQQCARRVTETNTSIPTIPSNVMLNETKIKNLQRNIDFLHTEHQKLISFLHSEIEQLKQENQDLKFELVSLKSASAQKKDSNTSQKNVSREATKSTVCPRTSSASCDVKGRRNIASGSSSGSSVRSGSDRERYLEEMMKKLQKECEAIKQENEHYRAALSSADGRRGSGSGRSVGSGGSGGGSGGGGGRGSGGGGLRWTLHPLRVHPSHHRPRQPTLAECEHIITTLHGRNHRQKHDMEKLKDDLQQIFINKGGGGGGGGGGNSGSGGGGGNSGGGGSSTVEEVEVLPLGDTVQSTLPHLYRPHPPQDRPSQLPRTPSASKYGRQLQQRALSGGQQQRQQQQQQQQQKTEGTDLTLPSLPHPTRRPQSSRRKSS